MPEIIFKHDVEKDIFNIWQTCNQKGMWHEPEKKVPTRVMEIAKDKNFDDCKTELIRHYKTIYDSKIIEIYLESLNKSWKTIENEFIKRVERIFKKPFFPDKLTGYLTMAERCPYSPDGKWFMNSFFSPILPALLGAAHEMLHFQFHEYYWDKAEKEIGKEKTADLKEAMTIFLKLEFTDIFFVKERGYEVHQNLRKFIEEQWALTKDFDVVLNNCFDYLKSDNI